jgi:mono/diheme cytochrome c family protein
MRIFVLSVVAAAGASLAFVAGAATQASHFANADNDKLVMQGKEVYRDNCASCHGRSLEGQFLWQLQDQYAHMRAPAHDATGHTWMHSDEDLFAMTKYGRFPGVPKSLKSYMPAFEHRLSDAEIVAAIAYIKVHWPTGIRVSQSMLNPHFAGMPKDADKVEWTLPPTCTESYKRWKVISR